ncbi:uncharacterized protein BCR38DRAFT_422686 [Pseudomassariella vexata]|uniref:Uncharacterized protein n=1 Tax=Pseudomassariella vexata TaxID=1141098 RepID=A0A1Y2EA75_9PEZI|nr:uncharacterized protein BCR38DRAFT_422686 [Pseudomassariella vexata]ORY68297.1 hypothetical protein BCR38DRAFT_422686 [Pseudomassariella vexata]
MRVCTREAAKRFRRVVDLMGTAEDMRRGKLILLYKLCIYTVPRHLQLPLEVVQAIPGLGLRRRRKV